MTIHEAAQQGIARLRKSIWSPKCYLRLDLFPDGSHGPLVHLYDAYTQGILQVPIPQDILATRIIDTDFIAHTGELHHTDKND